MTLIKQSFRKWWQPPRKAGDRPQYRQVTFLELFYDLVYVALIAQLSLALSADISWTGLGRFSFLFIIVWWAWLNGTTYHDLHGNNDIRTRIFTFLQMLCVIAMAVFARNAMGEDAVGFAFSYAGFQFTLTFLWWRTGVHDPDHRPLSRPYSSIFFLNTLLFMVSAFTSQDWRFYLWGGALVFSLLLPVLTFILGHKNPQTRAQIKIVSTVSPSLVERFGLFTIIVLGEVVVGIVGGVTTHQHLNWNIGGTALLGALIAIGIWWVYFDFVSHHIPRSGIMMVSMWLYLHLPTTIGIVSVGATVLHIIENGGENIASEVHLLLATSLAIILSSIAILIQTVQQRKEHRRAYYKGQIVMLASAVLMVGIGFSGLDTFPVLASLVFLLLAPVFFGFLAWLKGIQE